MCFVCFLDGRLIFDNNCFSCAILRLEICVSEGTKCAQILCFFCMQFTFRIIDSIFVCTSVRRLSPFLSVSMFVCIVFKYMFYFISCYRLFLFRINSVKCLWLLFIEYKKYYFKQKITERCLRRQQNKKNFFLNLVYRRKHQNGVLSTIDHLIDQFHIIHNIKFFISLRTMQTRSSISVIFIFVSIFSSSFLVHQSY